MLEVGTTAGRVAYGNVAVADVPFLLSAGMLEGKPIAPFYLGDPEQIPFLKGQTRVTFARCGRIACDSPLAYEKDGGLAGLRAALQRAPQDVIDEVQRSQLRGRGGAAFPTGVKWQTVAACAADQKYIVANGDEGDPGTYADRMLMEGDPFAVLEGMAIAAWAVGASQGFVYIRAEYPRAAAAMRTAAEKARQAGWLGRDILSSGFGFDVEVRQGGGTYVCGEETALLESLEGKRGIVRAKPPYPATCGLFGKPTIVNNITTLATIPAIIGRGGDWYASMGTGRSRGAMALQLAGALATPGLVEVPFGITLRQVIQEYGGGARPGRKLIAVQAGGPLGDLLGEDRWDIPIDFDAFAAAGGMLGHGGIVAYDDQTDIAALAYRLMEFCAHESCGKCAPCRMGAQRSAEILASMRLGNGMLDDEQALDDVAFAMRGASLCALGGMAPTPVLSAMKLFPEAFRPPTR
jgi:formate dehydrogenase iron-sulfur subunit